MALIAALGIMAGTAGALPANDNFTNAWVISGPSGATNGNNTLATLQMCETNGVNTDDNGFVNVTNSVWFKWTAPATGPVEFDTIGSSFDSVLSVWSAPSGICGASLLIADNNNGGIIVDDNANAGINAPTNDEVSLVEFDATAGTTYYISVDSWDDGTFTGQGGFGPYTLNWNSTPPNDDFANAWVLSGLSGTTNGNNTLATLEPCETNAVNSQYLDDAVTNSVWFAWTAPTNGTAEFDTAGSTFETILSVWTTSGGLCSPTLTNLVSNDSYGNANPATAEVTFSVVSNTTYYVSLDSFYTGAAINGEGDYVLNWNVTSAPVTNTPPPPTLVSGPLSFTASTYVGSQSDSTPPIADDGNTVSAYSLNGTLGIRVTVTRPAPAYGRVLVDYAVAGSGPGATYTNSFTTNYFGTNVLTTFYSNPTDMPPFMIISNLYMTNILVTNLFQVYNANQGGYQTVVKTYDFTNSATQVYNVAFTNESVTGPSPLASVPTNFPFLTNFVFSTNFTAGGFVTSISGNVFGYLQNGRLTRGTNFNNGSTITNDGVVFTNFDVVSFNQPTTNFFGTNIAYSYQSPGFFGNLFTTNFYFTNEVGGLAYVSNSVYTNGGFTLDVSVSGTNWFTNPISGTTTVTETVLNASNYLATLTAIGEVIPPMTNVLPFANFSSPPGITFDSASNQIDTITNIYGYTVTDTQTVASGNGISQISGTVALDNLQMSADIVVPVSISAGPDSSAPFVAGLATIALSNPRLDPNEDSTLIIPPTLGAIATAQVNALSPDFNSVEDPAAPNPLPIYASPALPPPGVINFERSTFRVSKNVNGGNAIISVYRIDGNPLDSVSVDYVCDPNYPNYTSPTPLNVDNQAITLYSPANSFPLQADSDYATPSPMANPDFTPVTGTLNWGVGDYNPKQISIPILNNGLVELNGDISIQLQNPLPVPAPGVSGVLLGNVNRATLTELFDNTTVLGGVPPGQQPAGAVDRSWNADDSPASVPPYLNYPGTTPGNGGTVYALAEQPDGNCIIAGSFVSFDSNPYNRIVRVLPNGYQDPTFQGNSSSTGNNSGANDFIAALALQPNGAIIIGGNFTAYNGFNRYHIARLNSNGSLDTTFDPGLGANGTIWSIALESSGQIIIGGEFTSYNGTPVNGVARLNADGSLDATFNPGVGPDGTVNTVAVDSSQRVLIGGNFAHVSGVTSGGVARLNVDGSVDASFAPGIGTFNPETFATDPVNAIAIQPNGQILIGGSFANYDLVNYNGLARLNPDGTLDLTLSSGTGTLNPVTGVADTINTIALDPAGNIIIGGNFVAYNQTRRYGLARVFSNGSLDTSFMDTMYNQFAGLPNQYFNPDYVSPTYPYNNSRNAVYAIALESNPATTSTNIVIGGTFEEVGGGSTRDDMRPRSNVARVIGGSTPGPGNIELSYNSYSVANSDGSLFVSLVRTNGSLANISATFTATNAAPGPGIATAGTSFFPTVFNPEWATIYSLNDLAIWMIEPAEYGPNYNPIPLASGLADVTLDIAYTPGVITGNLSALLGLSAPVSTFTAGGEYLAVGPALGAQMAAPLTIIDSNIKPGVLGFSVPNYTVVENGSVATITVTRTNGAGNAVSVEWQTSNGTGLAGVDYNGATNQVLDFAAGVTNATFQVATLSRHTTLSPDKTVLLTLYNPANGATLGLSNATLTLVNPNFTAGQLSFSATNYSVPENGGAAVVTVNRLGGSATTLGVTFNIVNGTATNGINYNYPGFTTNLFWNSGDVTSRIITIPVINDGVVTPNLVAYMQLTNSLVNGTNNPQPLDFGNSAAPTNATLTIVNVNSAGSIQFSSAIYSVKKYAGYALIPVTRTGGSIGTVTVNFTTLDDKAVAGVNYMTVSNTLTFTNGQLSQLVTVPIIGTATNGLVDLFLQLSTNGLVTQAALGSPTNATLNIIDTDTVNEPPGSIDPTYSPFAGFNGDVYALALQPNNQLLVGGDFTTANSVPRNRIARLNSDGSLDPGYSLPSDSYGASGDVRSIAVQTDGRILIGGLFTNVNSIARSYIARLNSDGTLDSLFNPGSGADNPVYAVAQTFENGNPMVLLGGAFATVNGATYNGVAQLNSDGTPDITFNSGGLGANGTVYALAVQSDGKILIGGDFTSYNGVTNLCHIARLNPNGSVDTNFMASSFGASDSVHAIAVQLDGRILIGGLFTSVNGVALNHIARLNTDGTVDGNFNSGLGANDSVFTIALQSDTRIVLGGEFTTCSGVTRNRITRLNPDGTVDPAINFGSGANDFVAAIAIQEDTITDYPTNVPDEKIIIGGGFTEYNGATNEYIARIFGGAIGGSGAFQFSAPKYQVDENGGSALITVVRTGGTTNPPAGTSVSVTAYTSNGTALAGTNYTAVTTNLVFPLGEVVQSFAVPVTNNGVVSPNLTVNLAITNPTAPAVIGNQPTAVLTIIDDNSSVSFSSSTYSVPKNIAGGMAAINIIRDGGIDTTNSVTFTTTGGTANPGSDYTPVTQTVIFTPGVTNVAVDIPILDNPNPEGPLTVTMQLSSPSDTILAPPTNAVLTIIDTVNAAGELSFALPAYSVTEGGGVGYTNVTVTVQRLAGSSGTISAGYTTQDGTATAPGKYASTNGVLTFGDGETSKTISVPIVNTTTAEGPETFSIYLFTNSTVGNAPLGSPTNTVVTILNTNTGIAFASAINSYTEPYGPVPGTLLLDVVRYNNTNGTVTVNYSTTNGTAVAGTDFVGVTNGIITFHPGDSVVPISITTMYNTNVTGNLLFTVGLANPTAPAQLTPPTFTTVIDQSANAGISMALASNSVARNAGFVLIAVTNSNPNVEPFSVNYATSDGSAVAGKDYTATSGTLYFTNGIVSNYFVVPILINNSVQSNRTFSVSLSGATPPGIIQQPTEQVTIIGTNTPSGLSFTTPIIISGVWGTTNVNNSQGAPESGDPEIAGFAANAPVWFEWTAPPGGNGEVTLDTIGSLATNGLKLDTVLAVFTGNNLSQLNQVAANDDLYPNYPATQFNEDAQNIFNTNPVVTTNYEVVFIGGQETLVPILTTNTSGEFESIFTEYTQPFGGPSGLRFNATAGTTYYIAADTKASGTGFIISNGVIVFTANGRGTIQLSWAYHPAGVFRFATERVDQTGIQGTNGNPMLLYECAETEGNGLGQTSHRIVGPLTFPDDETTFYAYYHYDVNGLLVTVTRVAGASGRVMVNYSTVDGNTNIINNGDIPATGGLDYTPVSGTLIFDDFEMSKTIRVPIIDDGGLSRPNRDFMVVLSNPQRDPAESDSVSQPRVDPIFGQVLCRILDCDIDPKGPSTSQMLVTNITLTSTNVTTNIIVSLIPTNAVFNFSKANYRIPRDVQGYWNGGTPVTLYVNRMGTNTSSVTLHYRFDNVFLDQNDADDVNNEFPLQPGSDYATPTPPGAGATHGTNSDFAGVGGDSGSLTFPGGKNNPFQSQPIHFNVQNNRLTEFNKDIHVSLYQDDSNNNPEQDGMVAEADVTILFDDTVPPAGSVDELYNPDFATDLALLTNSLDLNSTVLQPGTDPLGVVYSLALTPNNKTIIGGAFATYTDSTNTYTVNGIARINADGSLDPTFNVVSGKIASGVNVVPGDEFIRSVALTPNNEIVIGGDFTSFDGVSAQNIALLSANGTLDTTFNTGTGANGTVWSVLAQPDGKVLIGGDFTSYNGQNADHIARLNTDGSLDSTFNPSNIITGPVYAMNLSPLTPLNFNNISDGSTNQNTRVLNLGLQTSGALSVTYDMANLNNTNQLQIYYGTAATGILLFQTTGDGFATVPFGPAAGQTNNVITVIVNQGGSTAATPPPISWSYNIFMPGSTSLVIGGDFGVAGQSYANVAELNTDGSLNTSFNPGTGPNGPVYSLGWQFNGQVVAGGSFQSVSGLPFNNLVRFNADGSIDSSFFDTFGADNTVNSITLQAVPADIYLGGPFTKINGTHRSGYARLNPDGSVDTTFLDMAYNQFAGLQRILYADSPGVVYSSALQADGNIIIGGSFEEVGGGQADAYVRLVLEDEEGLQPSTSDPNLLVSEGGGALEPKTRDGIRNRTNLARLIGGSSLGPGNIGMVESSYAVNRTQLAEPVTLVRNNGSLGYASANFAVVPSLAQSGIDYDYSGPAPLYPISWEYEGPTRMHSDGEFGADGDMQDIYGEQIKYGVNGPASVLVSILPDSSVSGDLSAHFQMANPSQQDEFYLGGQDIPVGVALGEAQVPLTLIDNSHEDGVFSFAAPSFTSTNSPSTVSITRSNGTFGAVQLNFQTTTNGSTAVANVDYTPTNGMLTFASGQGSGSFPVTILNNGSIAAQEKDITVQLYNVQDLSGGNAQLGLTNALVRIINPNFPGFLNLTTNAFYGQISSGVLTFTVARTVGSQGSLTVQYYTADFPGINPGFAKNGSDYVGATNTLTWNNGDASTRTISIPLLNTNRVGGNKSFGVYLTSAALNGVSTPSLLGPGTNATLEIIDLNNNGYFQFSSSSYQYNEDGGYATITVTRTGAAPTNATIHFSTVDGTAFAGTNYVTTNNTLTFGPGQVASSFNVQLINDGKTNPPPASFYFGVQLSNPGNGALFGSPTNALVHIVDAQTFNQPPGTIDPSFNSSGMNGSVLALALQPNGQIVAGGTFTVADGAALNRIARLNTDGTLDGAFLSGLAGADGAVNTVICQTDSRIVVGGAFANFNGVTHQGIARLMTDGTLDSGFNSGSGADSPVFALAETFIGGSRYIYVGGAFSTFNSVSSPGIIRLNNSGLVDTTFNVGGGANGTVYAVAAYPTNAVFNNGQVLVGGLFTNFNGQVAANLVRLNPDGSMDTNFNQNASVNAAVRAIAIQLDGRILIGGDFTNVDNVAANHIARLNTDGTLDASFNAADAPGMNGTVDAIALQQNNCIMVGGQFIGANNVTRENITRLLPTGAVDPSINFGSGANGAINAIVVQPADDNCVIGGGFTEYNGQTADYIARIYGGSVTGTGAFQFTTANYQVNENAGFAGITIERTGGTSGPNPDGSGDVYVAFNTTNGTALAGTNYVATTNYVAFPPGEVLQTVFVPVINTTAIGPNLTVDLMLSDPTGGAILGNQANALLTIINDNSEVVFDNPAPSVHKDVIGGLANIVLDRIGSTNGSCSVDFATTTNGDAVVGLDYFPTNVMVTFNPGQSNLIVQVSITNNLITEGPRTVGLVLSNAINTYLASPSNALLTIEDTTTNPGDLFFASTNYSAASGSGYAQLAVLRTDGTFGPVSVTYNIVGGTAVPGLDYVAPAPNSVLNFSDNDTNENISIQLLNDPVAQVPVTILLQLSNPGNGAGLIAPTNAALTIYNTNAVFAFQQTTNYAPENTGPASIIVQRFNNLGVISTVNYATTNGTALAGINYSNTSGTLTFGLGQSLAAISVPLINQSNVTDETFGINLSNPTNGYLVAPSNTVVDIQGAAAGMSFTTNLVTVGKNAGFLPVTVICSNPRVEPVVSNTNIVPLQVNFTTMDGTAKAGINYGAVSGVLTFENGTATNIINVPIFNNPPFGNLSFSVLLTNVTAPGFLTNGVAPGGLTLYSTQEVLEVESSSGVSFAQANYSDYKNAGTAVITVQRTGYTNSTVAVNYLATNGTAITGQNFYATNGTLIFSNGVTSQSFNVELIANTLIQPNLNVLLQLSNPTNLSGSVPAQLVNPAVATLTILETGGSYVVPAGSQLLTNSLFLDQQIGVIGSNDTVQVLFAFRDAAGQNVTNLVAYLLATNGVVAPSPASQAYGGLTVYGHSKSMPFSFTAQGTNSYTISPTFMLYDNGSFIGPATFTYTLGAWTTTFANSNAIIINQNLTNATPGVPSTPYPSLINVSGLGNILIKATVTLTNLSVESLGDIDALVASPTTNTLIMGHVGGTGQILRNNTLIFDDAAPTSLPQNGGPPNFTISTNKPTQYGSIPPFP